MGKGRSWNLKICLFEFFFKPTALVMSSRRPMYREWRFRRKRVKLTKRIIYRQCSSFRSKWTLPLWIVLKKADEKSKKRWRLVIDFRRLNGMILGDAYLHPNINKILDQLGRAKCFSVFDLTMGFHQIPMNLRTGIRLLSPQKADIMSSFTCLSDWRVRQ